VNGVDSDEFHPGPADRARFGLPQDAFIGLFAGDLHDSRKNLETVLKALPSVANFHLAVAGRHAGTSWARLAAELEVVDRVHFLGFQRNMPELMRAVDAFVFPSRYEPFGLVLLEALASGLPVVTAQSAGGAEIVTPRVGFVLQDSEDIPSLSRALTSLFTSSKAERETMSLAARGKALEYSWADMAAGYLRLLEAAAANKRVA
jgi:glycosyltransferase involved in cell wall biosynthesis